MRGLLAQRTGAIAEHNRRRVAVPATQSIRSVKCSSACNPEYQEV